MGSREPTLSELHAILLEGLSSLITLCQEASGLPASALGLNALRALRDDPDECDRQCRLLLLLAKWNRVYNLTAVRELEQMVSRHLLDSLSVVPWLPESARTQADVVDLGSGAGLPVLPLAMARPDLHYVSIESNRRKTRFQQQALIELGLSNVVVVEQRVEQVIERGNVAMASLVLSRAFAAPEQFLRLADHLLAPDGRALIMLGQPERLPDSIAGWNLQRVSLSRQDAAQQRHLAVCVRRVIEG